MDISLEIVQHAIVTVIAFAAAAMLVHRLVGFARPPAKGESACKACASGQTGAATCATVRPETGAEQARPAVLYRPGTR